MVDTSSVTSLVQEVTNWPQFWTHLSDKIIANVIPLVIAVFLPRPTMGMFKKKEQ